MNEWGIRRQYIGCCWENHKEMALERPRCRHNIKLYHRETEWDGGDWTNLYAGKEQWQALVNVLMNLQVP
jgi:hypothetical protein